MQLARHAPPLLLLGADGALAAGAALGLDQGEAALERAESDPRERRIEQKSAPDDRRRRRKRERAGSERCDEEVDERNTPEERRAARKAMGGSQRHLQPD